MCLSDSRFLRLLRKCWFERIRRPHFTKCWKRATSASDSRWRITGRGATNSVDKGSKHSIRRFISRLGWESLARPARCNKRRPDSGGCGTIWGDGEREGGRDGGRDDWRNSSRGGCFRERDESPFRSLAAPSLSPSARVRTPGFFLPSASFRLSLSPNVCVCVCVPVGANLCLVWQQRFRRHDDEPRKPSHSLTPPLALSRFSFHSLFSLSLSLSPLYTHTRIRVYVFNTILHPHIGNSLSLWPVCRDILSRFSRFFLFCLSVSFASFCSHANSRLRLLRVLHIYRVHAAYVCIRLYRLCRPVHPPPRFCPWCCTPAIPRLRGWRPQFYAKRDPRAGPGIPETRKRTRLDNFGKIEDTK